MQEYGKLARDGAGWHVCLEQLARALDGGAIAPPDPDHWRELNARYAERLGPEAATIGPPEEWERATSSPDEGGAG
jgi:hypothetical protein